MERRILTENHKPFSVRSRRSYQPGPVHYTDAGIACLSKEILKLPPNVLTIKQLKLENHQLKQALKGGGEPVISNQ